MDLIFNIDLSAGYEKASQIARVLTEDWVERNMYCPICGAPMLSHYEANRPVADFFCEKCKSDFELKSKKSTPGILKRKIVGGAYDKMIERITSLSNPHLFVMTYHNWSVSNLLLIPKHFFVPGIIEKRQPLRATARRAGWVGCNIEIGNVPESGRIFIVRDGKQEDKAKVLDRYQRALTLRRVKIESRGWLLDVLRCVEQLQKDDFCLDEVYAFAPELQRKHPENNFIRDKIRQQLQALRDKGFIRFTSRGYYQKVDGRKDA